MLSSVFFFFVQLFFCCIDSEALEKDEDSS